MAEEGATYRPGPPGRPLGRPGPLRGALVMAELIYHATVREVRKSHRSPIVGLLLNILQTVLFIASFYLMFLLLGVRRVPLRGDLVLFLMSGILLFMLHTKTVGAIARADGPTSALMKHAPLNTYVTMGAAALGALYIQVLSTGIVLFVYHVAFAPVVIDEPLGAVGMLLLAWFSGIGVGVAFAALKPWAPDVAGLGSTIYARVNMLASGKMFVANALPGSMLALFDWNPLFHVIDQSRGYVFLNYAPFFSSWAYALAVSVVVLVLGLIGESYTRRHASMSWGAGR